MICIYDQSNKNRYFQNFCQFISNVVQKFFLAKKEKKNNAKIFFPG